MTIPPDQQPPANPQPRERLTDEDSEPTAAADADIRQRSTNARVAMLVVGAIVVIFLLLLVVAPLF